MCNYDDKDKENVLCRIDSKFVYRFDDKAVRIIAKMVSEIAAATENKYGDADDLLYNMIKLFDAKDFKKCILLCDKMATNFPNSLGYYFSKVFKASAILSSGGNKDEVPSLLKETKDYFDKNIKDLIKDSGLDIQGMYALIEKTYCRYNKEQKKYLEAVYYAKRSSYLANQTTGLGDDVVKEIDTEYSEIYSCFIKDLLSLPHEERKVICILDDLPLEKPKMFIPVKKDGIASLIELPPGHPVIGDLYVGHPLVPNIYYPIETYKDNLFQSQEMELNYLLQCLTW